MDHDFGQRKKATSELIECSLYKLVVGRFTFTLKIERLHSRLRSMWMLYYINNNKH